MRWNPILNAFCASAYIGAVSLFIRYISSTHHDTPDTPLAGMAALSLFVFSAAVMAFLFLYQPAVLLIEHKTKEAVSYFLKTLATFGALTILLLVFISLQ